MRPSVALISLWNAVMYEFYDIETLRPMRPIVALLSLWKAFLHEFYDIENTTTDAAQCRFAFVVESIHA